jgi:RNA polymerase sigma-70 factor (ECF subfamily)
VQSSDPLRDRNSMLVECLARVSTRDQSAMATFYDETRTLVYSLVYRVLGVVTDAEEVMLDVYLQVWRTADRYDARRGTVEAWLLMMARSRAIDRLRSRRQNGSFPQLDHEEMLADVPAIGPDPEETSVANMQSARIRNALRTLSPAQRQAVQLAFFAGLTHSELAEHLGEPLGTIKTRIRGALHRLRAQLEP